MKRKSVTVMSAYIIFALLIGCGVNEEAETESQDIASVTEIQETEKGTKQDIKMNMLI